MKVQVLTSFFLLMGLLGLISCQCTPKRVQTIESASFNAQALSFAEKHLPKTGVLVQEEDGYAYLKVDDNYINELYPLLQAPPGFQKPPYFRRKNAPGAHISIVYEDEGVKLKEVGQEFAFKLGEIITVHPKKGVSYIILEVKSPELEKLRSSYGLSPKLKNHEFHISLAKKEHDRE